jgi:ParB-like chromosome segregation protein Spo0J
MLRANSYNPNRVPPPELALLRLSILQDGWTQPIVARTDGEIVDGFHRWTVASNAQVFALTGGLIPVVRLNVSMADQMMSTVRHNRARGVHAVLRMAEIVRALLHDHGITATDLEARLGMDDEEITRLAHRGGMPDLYVNRQLGTGWTPGTPGPRQAP